MRKPLYIVERSPADMLRRYFQERHVSLPDGYQLEAMQRIVQAIMEIEVRHLTAASRYERKASRRVYRNGYRESLWETVQGDITIKIPKLRRGTYYPAFLTPQAEATITSFIVDAYLLDVRFDDVGRLLADLNIDADPAQIATLHEAMYDLIAAYRERSVEVARVELDIVPIETQGRPRYLALALSGDELLEHDITPEADDAFWQDFIRRIDRRSMGGIEYVAVSRIHHVVRLTDVKSPEMQVMSSECRVMSLNFVDFRAISTTDHQMELAA